MTELMSRLGKSLSFSKTGDEEDDYIEATIEEEKDREYIPKFLYNHYLMELSEEVISRLYDTEIEPLKKRLTELEQQFKNHRHCLDKTYGEKPVY